ncbi:MAG: glycoside hydrolase family 31 protein [Caulobacteraceae bacterium]
MKLDGVRRIVLAGAAAGALLGAISPGMAAPVPLTNAATATFKAVPGGAEWARGAMRLRVEALTSDILRVRLAPDGVWAEDASWAVSPQIRHDRGAVTATADGFATSTMRVHVDPQNGALTVTNLAGQVITADAPTPYRRDGEHGFELRRALPVGEHVFGLGDKTGELDRRGGSFVDWNTDSFGFKSSTDPIYKSIPFFISAGGRGGAYGVFLDNTWRVFFDFAHKEPDVATMSAPNGAIDYYVIAGPQVRDVVRRYSDLTGKAPLTPRWALGYQQSRYSYMSASEVRQIAARLRAERFPTDVIWLDIDFQDRNRPFTTNPATYPDLPGLTKDLGADGFKLVTIADLHVAKISGYVPYDTGLAGDHFVHAADGSTYVGEVWPGPSVFPDFTKAKTRDWWGTLYAGFATAGVAGFWDDMNEPAVFRTPTLTMPIDNQHRIASDDFAPRTASHAEIHNVYGMENSRATYDGVRTLRPDQRAFVMTRASYAGGQRYATTWTGDNSSTWEHLRLGVHQILNLGLSGFSYSAADAGGFAGGPSPDLLTRWFEIGAFLPLFRDHSAKGTPRAEPWVDGPEHLAIRRRFVEARYRLMPYLYGLADENSRTGDPIMRPVFYDYPDALSAPCDQSMSFTLGRDLLIAAPPKPESPQPYDVCLPSGGWYDYWTGQPVKASAPAKRGPIQSASQAAAVQAGAPASLTETPSLDRLPVFVRAGAILPRQALVQTTAQMPKGPLELEVYPGSDCQGVLYDDDGASTDFSRGAFYRQTVRCVVRPDGGVEVIFGAAEGKRAPWWREIKVHIHGWTAASVHADVDGRPFAAAVTPASSEVTVELDRTVQTTLAARP